MALSAIKEYTNSGHVEDLFPNLSILEFWCNENPDQCTGHALAQLLTSSVLIENLLIKLSEDFDATLLRQIWQVRSNVNIHLQI